MARKEIVVKIQDRDQELTFKVKEMPAVRLQKWIIRAVGLILSSGVDLPGENDLQRAGAYLAEHGLAVLGNIDFEEAEPLLDEMLGCCSRLVEKVEERCTPDSLDNYVQDVTTLFKLHLEAFKLNLGFFAQGAAGLSGSPEEAAI